MRGRSPRKGSAAIVSTGTAPSADSPGMLSSRFLTVAGLILGYALSSSLLAIVNKFAVTQFPFPAALTAVQYITCTVVVFSLGFMKVVEHDDLKISTLLKFLPAATTFYVAIWTNTQLLKHANVETFIVFRSSTPLSVAIIDSLWMKKPWPSMETFFSLITILVGAIGYVIVDSSFTVEAYTWAACYLVVITFEMVYIKAIVMSIGLSTWGLVLYNNLLALIFVPPALFLMNEPSEILQEPLSKWMQPIVVVPVMLTCVLGLSISFFGFACRKEVSATAYTVIGVTNKLLTILVNILLWDKHASPLGIVALLVCISGGVLYQQAVSREHSRAQATKHAEVEEKSPLVASAGEVETTAAVPKA